VRVFLETVMRGPADGGPPTLEHERLRELKYPEVVTKAAPLALISLAFAAPAVAQTVDDAALQGIKVTSGRSSAWAQFNMPAVRLWLPRVANSAYSTAEFGEPKLLD